MKIQPLVLLAGIGVIAIAASSSKASSATPPPSRLLIPLPSNIGAGRFYDLVILGPITESESREELAAAGFDVLRIFQDPHANRATARVHVLRVSASAPFAVLGMSAIANASAPLSAGLDWGQP